MDAIVLIVLDSTALDCYVICAGNLQSITVLYYARAKIAAAATLIVKIVIPGFMRDCRITGYIHSRVGFDIDGRFVFHPYRCVDKVQHTAVYIDIAVHCTVVIAE